MLQALTRALDNLTKPVPERVKLELQNEWRRLVSHEPGQRSDLVHIYTHFRCFNTRKRAIFDLSAHRIAQNFMGEAIELGVHPGPHILCLSLRVAPTEAQLPEQSEANVEIPIRWLSIEPVPDGQP